MNIAIHVIGLFAFGDDHRMITSQSGPELTGETVTVSYVTDPSISRGQFRLRNPWSVALTARVNSAWLEIGSRHQTLVGITVFDLDQEQMVSPGGFKVDAATTVTFILGFPRIAYEPRFGESSVVGLRLDVNGVELQALSPIVFERRIPKKSNFLKMK